MTSKNQATECFVYITLPGKTEAVTAGRFVLTKSRDGTPLGKFVYGKSYLARNDAVEIDPVELKLSDETYETSAPPWPVRRFARCCARLLGPASY